MEKNLNEYFNGDTLAQQVWKNKYAAPGEKTPDDMHRRLASKFFEIEKRYLEKETPDLVENLSVYGRNREDLTMESIFLMIKDFRYIIPQGRVMAGLGVEESYRSLSNCLRLPPPKDSYSSIMYTDTMLVSAAKRGCGYGLGLSNIRPRKASVSNAATSSTGAASFMERYSTSTREVAQEGRRGACLEDMSIYHPDVLEFIEMKKDKTKVTGANVSVKLNNEFMRAVAHEEDFILRWPCDIVLSKEILELVKDDEYGVLQEYRQYDCDTVYTKKVKAKEYWDIIIENAWGNAEPGLFFWDRVLDYDPSQVYEKFEIDGTNACGEQPMAVYDTCRLILLNLYSFVKDPFTPKASIDFEKLYVMAYEQMRLGDDLVDLEIEYINRIINKILSDDLPMTEKQIELDLWYNVRTVAEEGRRVGCGITALADMLAALWLRYDDDEAIAITKEVMKVKMQAELDCTIDLAKLRGTFVGSSFDKEFKSTIVNDETIIEGANSFYNTLISEFPEQTSEMLLHGRRNINWSTIAPAGSTSIIAKTKDFSNLSSGCEPVFLPYYMRITKINPSEGDVKADFIDDNGDAWKEYAVMMGAFKQYINHLIDENLLKDKSLYDIPLEEWPKIAVEAVYEKSPWYKSTANDIDWVKRIEMQAVLQTYTTSAISSTLNLPAEATKEEVSTIYFEAWNKGLKGVTIYRDGCRSGVLSKDSKIDKEEFNTVNAIKRPKELAAETHVSKGDNADFTVIVGMLNNKPYEIFIDNEYLKYEAKGKVAKKGKGKYIFSSDKGSIDISTFMPAKEEAICRLISANLRHGMDIVHIVAILEKIPDSMFDFISGLVRVLKKYIPDGTKASGVKCQSCGSSNVIFQEGCQTCRDCGSSKCG